MEIKKGTTFSTPAESGCVALESPNESGNFLATAPDGVECNYVVAMVCGYGHPDHNRVPHTCTEVTEPTPEQAEADRERHILTGHADPLIGRGPAEDAPRYAWTVEGEITSGTLEQYGSDYAHGHYSGNSVGLELWNGSGTREVWVEHSGTGSNGYMHYTVYVREAYENLPNRIIDWTYITIDGRA